MPRGKYQDMTGWDRLEWQLRYLIPNDKKRWFWIAMARKALTLNRKRIRKQKNLDGSSFAPRSDPDDKTKMLLRILGNGKRGDDGKVRGRQTSLLFTGEGVTIKAHNQVAAKHHFGLAEPIKSSRRAGYTRERMRVFRRKYQRKLAEGEIGTSKPGWGKEPVQPKTAEILRSELGFKKDVWNSGGKFRDFTESTAWFIIMEHRVRMGTYQPVSEIALAPRDVMGLNPEIDRELLAYSDILIEKYRY